MFKIYKRLRLNSLIFLLSIVGLLLLTLLTNPLGSVIAVASFFILLTAFIINLAYIIFEIQSVDSRDTRRRVLIFCAVIILLLMLRSAKALSLIDLGLMLLFFLGLTFYIGRR